MNTYIIAQKAFCNSQLFFPGKLSCIPHLPVFKRISPSSIGQEEEDSQKTLIFTEIVQGVEHLDKHKYTHGYGGWMSILENSTRVPSLTFNTWIKFDLQTDSSSRVARQHKTWTTLALDRSQVWTCLQIAKSYYNFTCFPRGGWRASNPSAHNHKLVWALSNVGFHNNTMKGEYPCQLLPILPNAAVDHFDNTKTTMQSLQPLQDQHMLQPNITIASIRSSTKTWTHIQIAK